MRPQLVTPRSKPAFGAEYSLPFVPKTTLADGDGKSHLITVQLDTDKATDLRVDQVNSRPNRMSLNSALWFDGLPRVRRTGPSTWEIRTAGTQPDVGEVDLAYLEISVVGPGWVIPIGSPMTAADLESHLSAKVRGRGGWSVGDPKPGKYGSSQTKSWKVASRIPAEVVNEPKQDTAPKDGDDATSEKPDDGLGRKIALWVGGSVAGSGLLFVLGAFLKSLRR